MITDRHKQNNQAWVRFNLFWMGWQDAVNVRPVDPIKIDGEEYQLGYHCGTQSERDAYSFGCHTYGYKPVYLRGRQESNHPLFNPRKVRVKIAKNISNIMKARLYKPYHGGRCK